MNECERAISTVYIAKIVTNKVSSFQVPSIHRDIINDDFNL